LIYERGVNLPDGATRTACGALRGREIEPIPLERHERRGNEFEVQRGGTDKADFAIVTKKQRWW